MSTNSPSQPINWGEITEQLQVGAYEAVAAYLWERQLASQQAGDAVTAAVLAAVRQLCLACHECQAKIAEHQQVIAENREREAELRTHAQAMLARMAGTPSFEAATKMVYPVTLATATRVPIWRRLWRLLGAWWGQAMLLPDTPPLQSSQSSQLPQSSTVASSASTVLVAAPSDAVTEGIPTLMMGSVVTADAFGDPGPVAESSKDGMATMSNVMPAVAAIAEVPITETVTGTEVTGTTDEPHLTVDAEEQPFTSSTALVSAPSLVVYCLGNFHVYQDDQLITEWPSNKGQLIFKYLLFQRQRPVAKELLMDLFWPDAPPDAARNNLNVAIYGLRRALRHGRTDFSQVLFRDDAYLLNPELNIWLDAEVFSQHFETGHRLMLAGQLDAAMNEYRAAEALYQGELLSEDRYEDWLSPLRQQLQDHYLAVLEHLADYYVKRQDFAAGIAVYHKMLAVDNANEEIHCNLMRCYSRQGHLHLALRQYHQCVEVLKRELDVEPDETTQALCAQIRRRKPI